MARVTQTNSRDRQNLRQFSTLGACVFWFGVVGASGGITGYLIFWLVPWSLQLPLPIWAYIPFAFVGLLGPLTVFFVICKYSVLARRLFFVQPDETDGAPEADRRTSS